MYFYGLFILVWAQWHFISFVILESCFLELHKKGD